MSTFGIFIKEKRLKKKIKQVDACNSMGITQAYLSNIENGRVSRISFDIILSLHGVLGVSLNKLKEAYTEECA